MKGLRSLGRSFACAFRGLGLCVRQERNFRIHLTAGAAVFWLASHFSLSRGEWALLLLAVGLMLAAEVFNTALEWFCDQVSPGWDKLARQVKDLSAGAVLVCALFCAGAGVALLWRPARLWELWLELTSHPLRGGWVLAWAAVGAAFVFRGLPPAGRGRQKEPARGENGKERLD